MRAQCLGLSEPQSAGSGAQRRALPHAAHQSSFIPQQTRALHVGDDRAPAPRLELILEPSRRGPQAAGHGVVEPYEAASVAPGVTADRTTTSWHVIASTRTRRRIYCALASCCCRAISRRPTLRRVPRHVWRRLAARAERRGFGRSVGLVGRRGSRLRRTVATREVRAQPSDAWRGTNRLSVLRTRGRETRAVQFRARGCRSAPSS